MTGQPPQNASSAVEVSSQPRSARWRPRLELVLALLALVPIALFIVASLGRLAYNFPLEQLEGSMLLAAERVAHGQPIYIRPNFTFIPYMYAPAYYYVSGWAVRLLGPRFLALRLVSLLSTCASMAVIYLFVFLDAPGTRARRHLAALAGAALYVAAYPWTREWFDLGRLDAFYILLLLLALLSTRYLHPIIAAAVWTLAFLAKQTIFPVALVMLCVDWKRPRRLLLGVGSFLLMTAISSRLLDHATDGWFWFYAFTVPHANADLWLRPAVFYISSQLVAPFGVALLIIAMACVWTRPSSGRRENALLPDGRGIPIWTLLVSAGARGRYRQYAHACLCDSGSNFWNLVRSPGCCILLRLPGDGTRLSAGCGGHPHC